MPDEICVKVKSVGSGRSLAMYYVDPVSGKRVVKTTGTKNHREAERVAGEWERELQRGGGQSPSKITWAAFRERYEAEHLATLAPGTLVATNVALDWLERLMSPDRLCKLTPAVISQFQAEARKPRIIERNGEKITVPGMKDTTLAKTLRHIKAALRWAERMGMLRVAPKIEMPRRVKGKTMMKGRPISGEEFDRMLAAAEKVRPKDFAEWRQYLNGLWLSGLRLEESLRLSWDAESLFAVDLTGRRPVFRIRGEAQKSGRDEILPMTPDFADWLQSNFPEAEREGMVFKMNGMRTGSQITPSRVGRIVTAIGQKAGVVVNREVGKFASAHDLRRGFGTRWAPRVKPATLQLLLRHSDIGTTMKYYVAQDAADVADELWASFAPNGNTCGNTPQKSPKKPSKGSAEEIDRNPCVS
jgi:integrase